MGYRLHVAAVYQVEYGSKEFFNNRSAAINRFLFDHCPDMGYNAESCKNSDLLKIPRYDLANLIIWLLSNPLEYAQWAKENHISECAQEFVNIIAYWIANSDQRNEYVVLNWH